MDSLSYEQRRGQLENYFDRTASETWAKLTSDVPVSKIRATVRAGRDDMRQLFLDRLPSDLSGRRILDAGCGTGALSRDLARRGANVVAIDIAQSLVDLAREREKTTELADRIEYRVGDMVDPSLGTFDHVVAMDSLIHYDEKDMVGMVSGLAQQTSRSMIFTFAPWTILLGLMHAAGGLFPRGDRAPAIEPIREGRLRHLAKEDDLLGAGQLHPSQRVSRGFYISSIMEWRRV